MLHTVRMYPLILARFLPIGVCFYDSFFRLYRSGFLAILLPKNIFWPVLSHSVSMIQFVPFRHF